MTTGGRMNQGTILFRHRLLLELTVWEYSLLARTAPEHIDKVERGVAAIHPSAARNLAKYGLDLEAVTCARPGKGSTEASGRRSSREFDAWRDVPYSDHARARRLASRGGLTLQEVGNELGISRERVRQIEERALRRFMRGLRERTNVDELRAMLEQEPHNDLLQAIAVRAS